MKYDIKSLLFRGVMHWKPFGFYSRLHSKSKTTCSTQWKEFRMGNNFRWSFFYIYRIIPEKILQYTLQSTLLTKLLYNTTRTIGPREQKAESTPRPFKLT